VSTDFQPGTYRGGDGNYAVLRVGEPYSDGTQPVAWDLFYATGHPMKTLDGKPRAGLGRSVEKALKVVALTLKVTEWVPQETP
jgi:hypothetical protein